MDICLRKQEYVILECIQLFLNKMVHQINVLLKFEKYLSYLLIYYSIYLLLIIYKCILINIYNYLNILNLSKSTFIYCFQSSAYNKLTALTIVDFEV